MDHLLYPVGEAISPLRVPLLCDDEDEYDGCSFIDYPCRRGWANPSNSLGWLHCTDDKLARRVQAWLYFGLLSAFCDHTIPRAFLCRIDELTGIRYLSTTKLHHFLDKRRNLDGGRILLREALQCSELAEQRVASSIGPLYLISCSVRVLLQTLNSTQGLQIKTISSTQRYHIGQRWPLKWSEGLFDGWNISPAKAIMYRMAALGWCPAKISDFIQKYSCSMLYYISGLPVEQGIDHSQCTELACSAYNIDESSYVPQHTQACSGRSCSPIEVTSSSVSSIIEDGFGVPLISCSIDLGGRVQSGLVRAEPHREYIAISHVWSGGLGNPNQNALPECQVCELVRRVHRLQRATSKRRGIMDRIDSEQDVLFWIDTFCIPVGEEFNSARQKAIDSMALIYSNASTVLVLDPGLQNLSYHSMGAEQALALVLCSPWMSRCWTLQEASLSKSWFVQIKDHPINIANVARQSSVRSTVDFFIGQGKLLPSIKRALAAELSRFVIDMGEVRYQRRGRYSRSEIWNLKQLESHQALSFATAWNNFQGRSTSKADDLHQILAGMADIRAGTLRPFALEDRMKAILKCHASLPIDLLFSPSERMHGDDSANSWAPRFPRGGRLDETFGNMKVFADCLFISSETSSRYLHVCVGQSRDFMADRFQIDIPTAGRIWIEIDKSDPDQYRHIQDRTICLMFPIVDPHSKTEIRSESLGARFLVQKQEGKDLHMKYDRPLQVYAYDRGKCISSSDGSMPTYSYAPIELAGPHSRIFIDCALETWPIAPLLYDSLEGPMFTKPAPYVLLSAYCFIQLTWTLAFVITMAMAHTFRVERVQIFYCFLARAPFVIAEGFWYVRVFEGIEREVWSLNFAGNRDDFSSYDAINSRPSLLFGIKRGTMTLILAIVFTIVGVRYHGRNSWILWLGSMLLLDFTLPSLFRFCWYVLPRYPRSRAWLQQRKMTLFPRFQSWFVRAREQLRVKHERVPFNEDDAKPFEETAGFVFGSYVALWTSFWRGADRQVSGR